MELRVGFVIDFVFCSFFEKVVFLALHSVVWGVRDSMHLHGMAWHGMAWHDEEEEDDDTIPA